MWECFHQRGRDGLDQLSLKVIDNNTERTRPFFCPKIISFTYNKGWENKHEILCVCFIACSVSWALWSINERGAFKIRGAISTSWNLSSGSRSVLKTEEERRRAIEWTRRKMSEFSSPGEGNCCEIGWWNKIYFLYGSWLKNLKAFMLENTRSMFFLVQNEKWNLKLEVILFNQA